MAKKRSVSVGADPEDEDVKEKMDEDVEDEGEDDDDDDDDEQPQRPAVGDTPFLDTFYGLASISPAERTKSAHAMLNHCLLGPNANSKDASYAFRRLLNGLCSGRAAARQGYASALTSFLKISVKTGVLIEIQNEINKVSQGEESILSFVRNQLVKSTNSSQVESGRNGKKKGSEERDYQFGRLFGILSVVRSGILLPTEDGKADIEDAKIVASGYANDLVDLYNTKKWMREPAAHGIITLLNSFYGVCELDGAKIIVGNLVKEVVIPNMLQGSIDSYTSEQIGVAINIQNHIHLYPGALPAPLDRAILSSRTIPLLVPALSLTSTVVQPRTHLVWDMVWQFLTEPVGSSKESKVQKRTLRNACTISDEPAGEVVSVLIDQVILKLLAVGSDDLSGNSTHDRRALALSLIKSLAGGVCHGSAGAYFVSADEDLLRSSILSPVVVRKIFLDVICAGKAKQTFHFLKPFALNVLESIVEGENSEESADETGDRMNRRFALAKCFLRCDPRFDARTKTSTIANLLMLGESKIGTDCSKLFKMWTAYVTFLEDQILMILSQKADTETDKSTSYEAFGYVDLLFNAAKAFIRLQVSLGVDAASYDEFSSTMTRRILAYFMSTAFFDCSSLPSSQKRQKKTKKKVMADTTTLHPVISAGLRTKEAMQGVCIPYAARIILSSRFFSLLADCVSTAAPLKLADKDKVDAETSTKKDDKMLQLLVGLCRGWTVLEESGATRFSATSGDRNNSESGSEESEGVQKIVAKMQENVKPVILTPDALSSKKERCVRGCTILASTLYLHLLSCGSPDSFSEDDDDEDDNAIEITEMITEVNGVLSGLLASNDADVNVSNPLLALAELCVDVLTFTGEPGNESRGASSKLLREAVKFAWIGGLSVSEPLTSEIEQGTLLDETVINVLLAAIGASAGDDAADEEHDDDNDSNDSEAEVTEGDVSEGIFSQLASDALDDDKSMDDEDMTENGKTGVSNDDDDDVEIDTNQLQSLLLEDSDAALSDGEEGELEHHAGADAALAQLIKMKQEARKAGRQARERLELSNQLRCVVLIETLLSNPGRQWNNLLREEILTMMIIPLLHARRTLEKSLATNSTGQLLKKGPTSEQKALLEKLTALLKSKLCKTRWAIQSIGDESDNLGNELMNEARRTDSAEHGSCCSQALIAIIRSMKNENDMVNTANVYREAVGEWSTKRTTRLQSTLFEDLIQQLPRVAQVVLTGPLSTATREARSPFMKSESFRLLSNLFKRAKSTDDTSKLEKLGLAGLQASSCSAALGIIDALQDSEMQKTKRVRDVLKATETFLLYAAASDNSDPVLFAHLKKMKDCLNEVKEKSESAAVSKMCDKCIAEIEQFQLAKGTAAEIMDETEDVVDSNVLESSGVKKKKKKKKSAKK